MAATPGPSARFAPLRQVLLHDPLRLLGTLRPAGLAVEEVPADGLPGRLARPGVDAMVVADRLGPDRTGVALIGELVQRGVRPPLVLVLPGADHAEELAALEAGAAACLDGSRSDGADLARAIRFAHAGRQRAEQQRARLLADLGGYLSHEARNALAGIRGAVQVVSDHLPDGSPDRPLCQEIRERVARFSATLDALSLVLRPQEELGVRREGQAVPLAAIFRDEARRLSGGARAVVTGEEAAVAGDRELLRLLAGALLQSAARAAQGQGQIQVALERRDGSCLVEVTHDAVTLPSPEELCEPFGTQAGIREGLGLPAAKRVAEVHGGSLELSASRGLRVVVRLPAAG